MVHRAFDLDLIDDLEMGVLYRNMARRRWRGALQEPFDSPEEMPLERPRMLRRGMDVILNEGRMRSAIRAALAFPEREIEQLAGLDGGFFKTAEVVQLATPKRDPVKAIDMETGNIIEFPPRKIN
jgi:hypothetical protein